MVYNLTAIWLCLENAPELPHILERYLSTLQALPCQCELLVIVNQATEEFGALIRRQADEVEMGATVLMVDSRCEEAAALSLAYGAAEGQVIAVLPSYLQSDPDNLPAFLQAIEAGADYVGSWRRQRVDSRGHVLHSQVFNSLVRRLSGVPVHDINSQFRVMRREVIENVPVYGDLHRFLPVLAARRGYCVTEVETTHVAERVRKGDYHPGVYLRRLLDLLTLFFLLKFTRKPLRFFGLVGSALATAGAGLLLVLVLQRAMGTALGDRPLLIFAVLMVVLGVQSFSLGLLGELIIFTHGSRIKEYHVHRVLAAAHGPPAAEQYSAEGAANSIETSCEAAKAAHRPF